MTVDGSGTRVFDDSALLGNSDNDESSRNGARPPLFVRYLLTEFNIVERSVPPGLLPVSRLDATGNDVDSWDRVCHIMQPVILEASRYTIVFRVAAVLFFVAVLALWVAVRMLSPQNWFPTRHHLDVIVLVAIVSIFYWIFQLWNGRVRRDQFNRLKRICRENEQAVFRTWGWTVECECERNAPGTVFTLYFHPIRPAPLQLGSVAADATSTATTAAATGGNDYYTGEYAFLGEDTKEFSPTNANTRSCCRYQRVELGRGSFPFPVFPRFSLYDDYDHSNSTTVTAVSPLWMEFRSKLDASTDPSGLLYATLLSPLPIVVMYGVTFSLFNDFDWRQTLFFVLFLSVCTTIFACYSLVDTMGVSQRFLAKRYQTRLIQERPSYDVYVRFVYGFSQCGTLQSFNYLYIYPVSAEAQRRQEFVVLHD